MRFSFVLVAQLSCGKNGDVEQKEECHTEQWVSFKNDDYLEVVIERRT